MAFFQRKQVDKRKPTAEILEKFNPGDFFSFRHSAIFREAKDDISDMKVEPLPAIELKPKGMEIIKNYYEKKYQCAITLPGSDFKLNKSLLQKVREQNGSEVRHVFIITQNQLCGVKTGIVEEGEVDHAIPLVYLRENGEEVLLLGDSIPSGDIKQIIQALMNFFDIPVLGIKEKRQSDDYSCYADALIWGRDITAKKEGQYVYPGLLSALKNNTSPVYVLKHDEKSVVTTKQSIVPLERAAFATKLPDFLLKTSQLNAFKDLYRTDSKAIIHTHKPNPESMQQPKNQFANSILQRLGQFDGTIPETLNQFKDRYKDRHVVILGKPREKVDNYLRVKGLKFALLIEIQFYLYLLRTHFAADLTLDHEVSFSKKAKMISRTGDWKNSAAVLRNNREALYQYANKFASEMVNQKISDAIQLGIQQTGLNKRGHAF